MPPSALSQVETTCLVCQPVVRDDWSAADLAETREGRRRLTISLVRIHLHRVRVSDRDVERPRAQDSRALALTSSRILLVMTHGSLAVRHQEVSVVRLVVPHGLMMDRFEKGARLAVEMTN